MDTDLSDKTGGTVRGVFWLSSVVTTGLATTIIVLRISTSTRFISHSKRVYNRIMVILIESGVLYSASILVVGCLEIAGVFHNLGDSRTGFRFIATLAYAQNLTTPLTVSTEIGAPLTTCL